MTNTDTERVYIEDIISEILKRLKSAIFAYLDRFETEEDREFDAFIDRLVAVREGKAPAYDGGWIPCSYRQPPKSGSYLTTTRAGAVRVNHFYGQGWGYKGDAVAWRPMPEAYKGAK